MARSFLSFTFALATATFILFGSGGNAGLGPADGSCQPHRPRQHRRSTPRPRRPSTAAQQARYAGAIKKLEDASRKYPELPSAHVLMYHILAK